MPRTGLELRNSLLDESRSDLLWLLLLLLTVITSCTPKVFEYSDELGRSTFKIYKNSFHYREKSSLSKFSCTGAYEKTDSTILFLFQDESRLPFTYILKKPRLLDISTSDQWQTLYILDGVWGKPMLFADIEFLDAKCQIIATSDSDIDGSVIIPPSSDLRFIKIKEAQFFDQILQYDPNNKMDMEMRVEVMQRGGRKLEGCFGEYMDAQLEYKIDNPSDINHLSKNRFLYTRIK